MENGIRLTAEVISGFILDLQRRGRAAITIQQYKNALTILAQFLSPDKLLCRETLRLWQETMRQEGVLSSGTINLRIAAANSLLQSIGHLEWALSGRLPITKSPESSLTSREYCRLLQTAKSEGREDVYYVIKTLRGTGVRVGEMQHITVELVRAGRGVWCSGNSFRSTFVAEPLKSELLRYAQKKNIVSGPIFINGKGKPIDRCTLYNKIQKFAGKAGLAPEKATPRCLEKLFRETYEGLVSRFNVLLEQAYGRILEDENQIAGWEN